MANTPQAKKRIRRNNTRAEINTNRVSRIRSFLKKVETAIEPRFQEHFVAAMAIPHKTAAYPNLAAAVKKFQQANELPATGYLDARTVKQLNAPVRDRQIDLIIANM